MKIMLRTLITLCALLLMPAAVLAHGDNLHGAQPQVEEIAAPIVEAAGGEAAGGEEADAAAPAEILPPQPQHEGGGALQMLKSLHPATVHFPIALFLMAALAELFLALRPASDLQQPIRIMVYGGAAGAVIASLFGWIHTGIWLGGDGTMMAHRWLGTGIAILGAAAVSTVPRAGGRRLVFRTVLFSIAAALIVQGFLGGELAHGAGHLGS